MKNSALVFGLALVLLLVSSLSPARAPLQAQETDEEPGRLALFPLIAVGTFGDRFREHAGGPSRLAPASGPLLGAGAELRVLPRVSVTVNGTYSSLSYDLRDDADFRSVGGRQKHLRFTAGTQLRIRPHVPGYFSLGAAWGRFEPVRPIFAPNEVERTELGGFAGVGMDIFGVKHALRAEGRIYLLAPRTQGAFGAYGVEYDARSLATDFTFSLAFVFRP
jgi:hypothetical protein